MSRNRPLDLIEKEVLTTAKGCIFLSSTPFSYKPIFGLPLWAQSSPIIVIEVQNINIKTEFI